MPHLHISCKVRLVAVLTHGSQQASHCTNRASITWEARDAYPKHAALTRHLKRCKQLTGLSIAESRDALTVPFSRTLQARGSSTFSEGLELLCIS